MKTLSIFLLFCALEVHAASFDCRQASTDVEDMICDDPGLSAQDESMALLYSEVLRLPKYAGVVRHEQRVWLRDQRNICHDLECLRQAYDFRIKSLQEMRASVGEVAQVPITPAKEKQSVRVSNDGRSQAATSSVLQSSIRPEQKNDSIGKSEHRAGGDFLLGVALFFCIVCAVFFWRKIKRMRCKHDDFFLLYERELDRWRQNEKVEETKSNGQKSERYVSFTYVKMRRNYRCRKCNMEWSEVFEEKK